MKHIKPYNIFESQEAKQPGFPTTEEEIHRLCKKYDIINYTINKDLSIDVEGDVDLEGLLLDYLPLNFNYVNGDFDIMFSNLISLIGCPTKITGHFSCYDSAILSYEYSPKEIGGNFDGSYNDCESLLGISEIIGGHFYCSGNNIKTIERMPNTGKEIDLTNNPIFTLINTFIKKDNVDQLIKEFNEYSIVRGDTVVLNRLKAFINDFELEMPDLDTVKEYYNII